jgi:hypothetical protein
MGSLTSAFEKEGDAAEHLFLGDPALAGDAASYRTTI